MTNSVSKAKNFKTDFNSMFYGDFTDIETELVLFLFKADQSNFVLANGDSFYNFM